ncbi:MAG: non-canonical purine NTP pyrophosphatase [Planctomycetota bacterium]
MSADLWIATGNAKKRAELERLLRPLGVQLHLPSELAAPWTPVEDQDTFAGNARKKAASLALLAGAPALADDSGLSVDALDGRPGVHSARYGGEGLSDQDRLRLLLGEMRDVLPERRTAFFTCSLCLCGPDGEVRLAVEQHCNGVLLAEPRGDGGFGYDPAFVAAECLGEDPAPTFAELEPARKDQLSHRGKALRALLAKLRAAPGLLAP